MALLFAGGSACFVVASLPGLRAALRLRRRRRRLLRRLAPVHVGRGHPVAPDDPAPRARLVGERASSSSERSSSTSTRTTPCRRDSTPTAYDQLVWTPDVRGSICFLVASYLALRAVSGGLCRRPRRSRESVIATANLVGSVAFGIAAIAAYWVPDVRQRPGPRGRERLHGARRSLFPRRGAPASAQTRTLAPVTERAAECWSSPLTRGFRGRRLRWRRRGKQRRARAHPSGPTGYARRSTTWTGSLTEATVTRFGSPPARGRP